MDDIDRLDQKTGRIGEYAIGRKYRIGDHSRKPDAVLPQIFYRQTNVFGKNGLDILPGLPVSVGGRNGSNVDAQRDCRTIRRRDLRGGAGIPVVRIPGHDET
jgi:hypothetical protein